MLAGAKSENLNAEDLLKGRLGGGWRYGHLSYELGKKILLRESTVRPTLSGDRGWPLMNLATPRVIVGKRRDEGGLSIVAPAAAKVFSEIVATGVEASKDLPRAAFEPVVAKEQYLQIIEALREHIAAGDCYEINFCNARFAQHAVTMDAVSTFRRLREHSPAPFSALYKQEDQFAICASPERYLAKRGRTLRSQPIKGTARRDADPIKDEALRTALQESKKERAENVMIVDLVRSDLAHSCVLGSVAVEELFGIQTFPTVHQMVSTVQGTLRHDQHWWDAVRQSFPMGSMTGAPKEAVMKLIEHYEPVRRGLFSGSLGYLTPEGDFDFNVVIRTLFYDVSNGHLSYSTGGAITWGSDAEAEWEETLLKGRALERIFQP